MCGRPVCKPMRTRIGPTDKCPRAWLGRALVPRVAAEFVSKRGRPAAITSRMHLHPDSVLPLAQLERARAPWKPEMPVVAASAAGQLAFASNDETTLTALGKSLI